MSNHRSSWMTSSVPRPTAYNSPALGRMSDIKGRLSFSAMKTPAFKPKQISLVDQAARASASPINGYHMSKQNPDVLDRLCSPSPSHRDHLLHKKTLTQATVRIGGGGSGVLIGGRSSHSTAQSSLVKQMLLNDKHRAPASLVHMATRGRGLRTGVNVSPVVVKLSGAPTQTLPSAAMPDSVAQVPNDTLENGTEVEKTQAEGEGSPGKKSDPCDKNVVLSALRQRRKRWATSAPDEDHIASSSSSTHVGAPSAKRTKRSSHGAEPLKSPLSYILGDRKRAYTAPSYSMSPDSKKSRFAGTYTSDDHAGELPSAKGKRSTAEEECDRESVVSELSEGGEHGSGRSSKVSSRAPSECVGGLDNDGRSLTPPVQFDEAEMNRKREESLNNLKAVFSPKGGEKKTSHRRKLPVFCATGTKPHLPTPLSTTHSVTQEDLKKDREAATAKLREILTAEDKPPPKTEATTTTLARSKALPTNSGARLSSSLSGSLPTLPSATSTAKTSLPSSTAAPAGLSLTVGSTAASTSITTSLPTSSVGLTSSATPLVAPLPLSTASAAPQTQVKSVSFAPLPVPTPSSTTTAQAGFSLQPPSASNSQAPLLNQPASMGTLSSTMTGLQLPQFASSLATATTATAAASNMTSNVTQQVTKPSGLVLGAPTLATTTQNQQLSSGLALPAASGAQLSLFQSSTSAVPTSVPSLSTTAPPQGGGSIFGGGTSAISAPSASTSSDFKFTLSSTTQQQQPQPSNSVFQSTVPASSAVSSTTATNGGIFGLNAGLQTANANSLPSSSAGAGGINFGLQQPQQPSQLSIFGGGQAQSSQANVSGVSFNFAQAQAQGVSGGHTTLPNSGRGLNFGNSTQQNPPGGSSLNFGVGSQSSGSGLSLFKNSGNPPQLQQQNNPPPSSSSSIFGAGSGPTTMQQPQSSSRQLQQPSQQPTAAGFTGFKLSTGVGGPQAQASRLSIFGQSNSAPSGGSTGGVSLTAGQTGTGSSTGSGGNSFPPFNVGANSSGFNFASGASNTGVGLFQKPGSSSSQPSNSLSTNGTFNAGGGGGSGINFSMGAANSAGSGLFQKAASVPSQTNSQQLRTSAGSKPQNSSGINFSFSANALASQSQQQQPSQGGTGLFAFGQKPSNGGAGGGGINFASTGGGNAPSGLGIGTQSQNGNGGLGFNFGGSGMGTNSATGASAGPFNASNVFQSSLQQQPSQNIFQTPQTQKQLSFTTPGPPNQQNTPTQGGINFQSTPFSFSAGTTGGDSGRPMARARRRKK